MYFFEVGSKRVNCWLWSFCCQVYIRRSYQAYELTTLYHEKVTESINILAAAVRPTGRLSVIELRAFEVPRFCYVSAGERGFLRES